jgi:hypothetical protein
VTFSYNLVLALFLLAPGFAFVVAETDDAEAGAD